MSISNKRRFDGRSALEYLVTSGALLPESDATDDLGSSTKRFKDAYFSGTVNSGGEVIATPGKITFYNGAGLQKLLLRNALSATYDYASIGTGTDGVEYHVGSSNATHGHKFYTSNLAMNARTLAFEIPIQGTTPYGFSTTRRGQITSSEASTSSTTGALQVTGGGYFGGNSLFAGSITNSLTTESTSTTTGATIISGGLGVAKTGYFGTGIVLPASGGTPTLLNYHEEHTQSTNFTGPWASNQAADIRYTRIGRVVTMHIPAVTAAATSATAVTMVDDIPARFRPTNNTSQVTTTFWGIDNSANVLSFLSIQAPLYSNVTILANPTTPFAGAGTAGWYAFNFTYTI